jgi:cytidyltransferase-like protein
MNKKSIIVSGYFNPLHKGHLEYLNEAKKIADKLIVIVNNDSQRELKGSKAFQDEEERVAIISNLKAVDEVVLSIDKDRTVCKTIKLIVEKHKKDYEVAFANGGDQTNETIPEVAVCEELGVTLIDGLGEKIQSSS